MTKKEQLEKEIQDLEESISNLENKLISKQKQLHSLDTHSHDFVRLAVNFELNGILYRKRISFGRGITTIHFKDVPNEIKHQNFMWFLKYCSLVEKQACVSGTALDYTIREYAKYFEIDEEMQEELMQAFWHNRSLTLSEIFETQELDDIESDVLYNNIAGFMNTIARMDSEEGFALSWYCNHNKKAIQQRIAKMPKNIDKVMRDLYKLGNNENTDSN